MRFRTRNANRLRPDLGASAVEYALLMAGIAVLILTVVFALGGTVRSIFSHSQQCIAGAAVTKPQDFTPCQPTP